MYDSLLDGCVKVFILKKENGGVGSRGGFLWGRGVVGVGFELFWG